LPEQIKFLDRYSDFIQISKFNAIFLILQKIMALPDIIKNISSDSSGQFKIIIGYHLTLAPASGTSAQAKPKRKMEKNSMAFTFPED